MSQAESFLRRWSRLKLDASAPAAITQPDPAGNAAATVSEFGAFLNPEVSRDVRQAALRTLFMTDHYRAMDGLDVYVGDYSKPELLAAEMLDKLDHARDLLKRDEPEPESQAQNSGMQDKSND